MLVMDKQRIQWACRRGMLELDLLLPSFFKEKFDALTVEEQKNFVTLLSEPDQDLYAWILNVNHCPHKKFRVVLSEIQRYHAIA